jgi:hypothetical protein
LKITKTPLILLLIYLGLASPDVRALEQESGAWLVGLLSGSFGSEENPSRWRYALKGQFRDFSLGDGVRQGTVRGGLGYQLNSKVTLWGGYVYFHTNVKNVGSAHENRIWQQVNWTMGSGDWGTLKSRTRLEQRFREHREGRGLWLRQQFRADIPVKARDKLSYILGLEAFFHLRGTDWADEGFIQNRVFIGMGYKVSPRMSIEVGYLNQFFRLRELPDLMNHLAIVGFRFK